MDKRKMYAIRRAFHLAKYSPDQSRDDHGRFGEGGGAADSAGPGGASLLPLSASVNEAKGNIQREHMDARFQSRPLSVRQGILSHAAGQMRLSAAEYGRHGDTGRANAAGVMVRAFDELASEQR